MDFIIYEVKEIREGKYKEEEIVRIRKFVQRRMKRRRKGNIKQQRRNKTRRVNRKQEREFV